MKLWLVIPVKPFQESKSRLHPVLNSAERAALSRRLLTGVLTTVMEFAKEPGVDMAGVLVISRDRTVRRVAEAAGAVVIAENGDDLNTALDEARRAVMRFDVDALLMLPSDLPLLAVDDLRALYASAAQQPGLTIAPSRDGGTNALLMRPPDLIDFAFGPDSFQHHCQRARASGHLCRVVESSNLAFDVDWPQDLDELAMLRQ